MRDNLRVDKRRKFQYIHGTMLNQYKNPIMRAVCGRGEAFLMSRVALVIKDSAGI